MKMIKMLIIAMTGLFIITGCNNDKKGNTSAKAQDEESRIIGNPPAGSTFAKLRLGMPEKQVYDLIGQPNDQKMYVTGKAWIPFYHGGDSARKEVFYKGQGRLTLAGGSGMHGQGYKIYRIIYDPTEDGYNNQ